MVIQSTLTSYKAYAVHRTIYQKAALQHASTNESCFTKTHAISNYSATI